MFIKQWKQDMYLFCINNANYSYNYMCIYNQSIYIKQLNMPFYLEMSKNITKQRDIYDTVIFRFLQIFYGLTMKQKV